MAESLLRTENKFNILNKVA